jgi:calcineurin-like phosphoesterase family protein
MKIRDDAWIIADTHFGHSNIIKYANRPFTNYTQMDNEMIEQWNSVVRGDDQVVFLGDFSLTRPEDVVNYRKKLNGEIIILLGNHDREFPRSFWELNGFKAAIDYPIVYKDFFILSHEPIDWISERLPVLNIHGHIHEKTHYNLDNNHYNVSVENINYTPVRLQDILKKGWELASV